MCRRPMEWIEEVEIWLTLNDTGILELCERPEIVSDQWNGLGRVLGGKNRA